MNVSPINSANSVILNIRGQEKAVSIAGLPSISSATKAVFLELGTQAPDSLTSPFQKIAQTLRTSVLKLQDAKDHSVRDKIFGLLRAALYVGVVAGGVLGTIALASLSSPTVPAMAIAATATAMGTLLAAIILAFVYSNRVGIDINGEGGELFFSLFIAPAFPIYEEFGKISRLGSAVTNQKQTLEARLSETLSFFEKDLNGLQEALKRKIGEAESSSKEIAGQREIEAQKKIYEKALEELDNAIAYYSQFQSN